MESNKTNISKDVASKKIRVTRQFEAPAEQVWNAWTNSELLDLWWAPKPWKAQTKKMDFREGGFWLYAMVGPDGAPSWCRVDYEAIVPLESFTGFDAFCDEDGNINKDFPTMHWHCEFKETANGTNVNVDITFSSEADMQKIVDMGFEEGFTAAHGNLDELLQKQVA